MTTLELLNTVSRVLNAELVNLSGTPISISTLATVAVIIAVTLRGSRMAQTWGARLMRRHPSVQPGAVAATTGMLRYAILLSGFAIAIQLLGIRLGALFTAGAIFAVGLGFAMKDIAENFVAGVILLLEQTIKPDDILEIQERTVRVKQLGIRTTVVETRDGEALIVPNSALIQSTKKNYTFNDDRIRVRTEVGVVYSSDMALVRDTLVQVAAELPWRIDSEKPQVLMLRFGSSSVDFEVAVWTRDPWQDRTRRSDLNERIWRAFAQAGITIAFPQLDVHFDAGVGEHLRQVGGGVDE